MHGTCKCPHHVVAKILMILVWVSGILFFVSGWRGMMVWGMGVNQFFQGAVVWTLLLFSTKFCGCCGMGMMKGGMSCSACEGRGGEHTHGDHGHM